MEVVMVNDVLPLQHGGGSSCGGDSLKGYNLEQTQKDDRNILLSIKKEKEYFEDDRRYELIQEGRLNKRQCQTSNETEEDIFPGVRNEKPAKINTFECLICCEKFHSSSSFQMHIKSRTGEICDICGKECCHEADLSRHLRTHIKETFSVANAQEKWLSCDKTFDSPPSLVKHKEVDIGPNQHKRVICQQEFNEMEDLKRHHKSHTGENGYECKVFSKEYNSKTCYLRHHETHERPQDDKSEKATSHTSSGINPEHISPPNSSDTYPRTCRDMGNINQYTRIPDGNNKHSCDVCGKDFDLIGDLNSHLLMHGRREQTCNAKSNTHATDSGWTAKRARTDTDEVACVTFKEEPTEPLGDLKLAVSEYDVGGLARGNLGKMNQTLTTTNPQTPRPYNRLREGEDEMGNEDSNTAAKERSKFEETRKMTRESDLQQNNIIIKKEQSEIPCSTQFSVTGCLEINSNNRENSPLDEHTAKVEAIVKMSMTPSCDIKCKLCGEHFTTKTDYAKHMLDHTRDKPFKCAICSVKFYLVDDLKNHVEMHVYKAEGQHKCPACNKAFGSAESLKEHCKIHALDESQQTASKGSKKKTHKTRKGVNVDSQIKEYKVHKSKLVSSHSEVSLFTCDICTRKFRWIQSFRRHMKMHSGENPYKCDKCDKRYYEASDLNRHMKTHKRKRSV
ncbi:zinc finger protein 43-like [Ylistrum balloti]|uniref:zinc finger protein 43-like n=1 Tax=Ylistrum balloti TaxID=509963 RepID=UPI002905AF8F|nr:zinc finger protein 43-like [Ylistrum balloti]